MYEILLGLFLVVALLLIGVILLQQGKGADMGASFGSGSSNTVFGASGAGNFLTRTTWVLLALFFMIALALGYMSSHRDKAADAAADVFSEQGAEAPASETPAMTATPAPATDVPAAPVAQPAPAGDVPN